MDTSSEDIQVTTNDGIFQIDMPPISDMLLKNCFQSFLQREEVYRKAHLQKKYGYAFDGYSFYGQKDSSNQAYDDLLETFVFSNFFPTGKYPTEFWSFLSSEWSDLVQLVSNIESKIISTLDTASVDQIHDNIGHMVSCNYYPAQNKFNHSAVKNTRLSAHPDVSLLTVFPFGIDGDLEYETDEGDWKRINRTGTMIAFPGYLMQLATDGRIKALNHRVKMSGNQDTERFSFAFFSLPFPKVQLHLPGDLKQKTMFGEKYFQKYLQLFD